MPADAPRQGPIAHALSQGRGLDQGMIGRALGLLGPDGQPISSQPRPASQQPQGTWFDAGRPQPAVAPREEVHGRAFDYQAGYNLTARPRQGEPVTFETLRNIADAYDPLRMAIETRKDQLSELGGSVQPRKKPNQQHRPASDDRCTELTTWFRKPDGEHYFDQWMRLLSEEQLVIDAPTLVRRNDRAGRFMFAEVISGDTISRVLDVKGRTPKTGAAYQQVLKGLPAVDYTAEEIIYAPRNPRAHKVYGYSPTEQVLTTVNIGLRRMTQQLMHYTDGNVPEALIGLPATWQLPQIEAFQRHWDQMQRDPVTRRRAKFVPGEFAYQPTRADGALMDQFDEWLARLICYAFSLPPTAFVRMMNRATAETSYDASIREGLAPLMRWAKNIIDDILAKWHGHSDLEWVWDDSRNLDPAEQLNIDERELAQGLRSLDDLRADRGLAPVGIGPIVRGIGPMGFVTVDQLKQIIDQGLNMPPPPMMMSPEGLPMDPAAGGGDPLAGASPEVLAQLGVEPGAEGLSEEELLAMEEEDAMAAQSGASGASPGLPLAPRGMGAASSVPSAAPGIRPEGMNPGNPGKNPRQVVRDLLQHVDRRMRA